MTGQPVSPSRDPQHLSALFGGLEAELPATDPLVTGVVLDSRKVAPGDLYVALRGANSHGAQFCAQARAGGAVAVLTDREGTLLAADSGLPVVEVPDPRRTMAQVAGRLHHWPAAATTSFGITGTNGKSTTVLMLAAGLAAAGHRVASIGTLGFLLDGVPMDVSRSTITTPESVDLQGILADMVAAGADCVAMEVSSHALVLERVTGIRFDVAAFTNLGRDHLDFHHTPEEYFAAKAKLFTTEHARRAVVNSDDEYGARLVEQAHTVGLPVVSVGFGREADYRITRMRPDGLGSRFTLVTATGELPVQVLLPGDYNIRNAATALAMIEQAGLDPQAALPGIAEAVIPGRMQPIRLPGAAPRVYVDFAHTPQAVASALGALAPGRGADSRVIAVLGAGGDRDVAKRGPMGAAAAELADVVVVTDDNPRSEDPAAIRRAVLAGAAEVGAPTELIDGGPRRQAIRTALELAGPQDAVAVLGKGHENTQQLADRTIEFDDVQVVAQMWADLTARAGGLG